MELAMMQRMASDDVRWHQYGDVWLALALAEQPAQELGFHSTPQPCNDKESVCQLVEQWKFDRVFVCLILSAVLSQGVLLISEYDLPTIALVVAGPKCSFLNSQRAG